MRNNLQNDVKVEKAKLPLSKFDLSGSISNTASIGEVSVKFSRLLQPGTKAICGEEQLVRMSPLVAPTYSRQWYKTWHMFVPLEDIFSNYSSMMTGEPISRNGVVINPRYLPHMRAGALSQFCLNGAKCTLYFRPLVNAEPSTSSGYVFCPRYSADTDLVEAALNGIWEKRSDGSPIIFMGELTAIETFWDGAMDFELESGNLSYKSFGLPPADQEQSQIDVDLSGYDLDQVVPLDQADQVIARRIEINGTWYQIFYAFRYSSWGNHLSKTLRGLGYGIDLEDDSLVTYLPLLASYKAYWDIFGLNLFQNFESTYCGRVISYINQHDGTMNPFKDATLWPIFRDFMKYELGAMWLTEQNDYISAHLPQPVVSQPNHTPLFGVVDVGPDSDAVQGYGLQPNAHITQGNNTGTQLPSNPSMQHGDGHANTYTLSHGALDSEILKRLYKYTNRNTALGRKIVDLMRAAGLGMYMERTRVNYIGDTSISLEVKSVTSSADTYNSATDEGALLGQYSGKGVGWSGEERKKLHYKTDCLGWWICLESVTCDSGYSQGRDETLTAIQKEHMYQPDFEDLGLELHTKAVLNANRDFCAGNDSGVHNTAGGPLSRLSFGFATRFSAFKVGRNCLNGGFANKSQRNFYSAYNMDKTFYPSDISCIPHGSSEYLPSNFPPINGTDRKAWFMVMELPSAEVPTAGLTWRYLGRFPWLQNLARIFANKYRANPALRGSATWFVDGETTSALSRYWEFQYLQDDNYIILSDLWFKAWAPMRPIEECYGTVDPDKSALEYIDRC